MSNLTTAFKKSRLFATITGESLRRLNRIAEVKHFRTGNSIFEEGDPVPGVYLVITGQVRIFKRGVNGKEHTLHFAGSGDTVAEVAVIGGFPCPASAEAITPTVCALLPTRAFRALLRDDPNLPRQLLNDMSRWVRQLVSLFETIVLKDAAGRVAGYILSQQKAPRAAIALPSLKRHLASHLNLTSETLSRVLRLLREEHLIMEDSNRRLIIRDEVRLRQIADGRYPTI